MSVDVDAPESDWVMIDSVEGSECWDWAALIQHKSILEEDDRDYDSYSDEEDDGDDADMEGGGEEEEYDYNEQEQVLKEVIKDQVLPRLPAKSLLRLKSTCQQWKSYISSPLFIHTHSLLSRSVAGLFFHDPCGSPSFAALYGDPNPLQDPSLSFLPEPVTVKSSAGGLLCCLGRVSSGYYVCNPLTAEWTALPSTLNCHGPDPCVAIVMQEPSAFNFSADYYVVCTYEVIQGVYTFDSFSSASRKWRHSNEIAAAERVVSGSGVSAGGCAYWRTTMQSVVAYNPETDVLHVVATAAEYGIWEIGELGRRPCRVSVEGEVVEVMVLEDGGGGKWRKVEEFAMETWEGEGAVPLRTQGEREVLLWEGRSRMVVARDVADGAKRLLVDTAVPGYCADFLPYVGSLVHVQGQGYVPT